MSPNTNVSDSPCSSDGGSPLRSELESWPHHYLLGDCSTKWASSAQPDLGSQKYKIHRSARPYDGRGEATNPVVFK